MSIQLDFGFIRIEIDNLVRAIHELTTTQLNHEAQDALKIVTEEVQKIIDKIVDTLSPLYSIDDDDGFQRIFPNQYSLFKSNKLKNMAELDYSCHVVIEQLDRLRRNRHWLSKLPFTQNKFNTLDMRFNM